MIPKKVEHEVYTGKSKESKVMGFECNSKAFEILSNSLYSNKERAVVREYMTNAYDSHMDAGCPTKPFKVHIPTKLQPYFEVQDFGIGMNNDDVMNTFFTFFHSTKEDDNTVNGCLGLGSKSAFAATDQFTIIAIKDGVRRTYLAYKNMKGESSVDLKHEISTVELNGVTIQIPVELTNVNKWQEEIAYVMACFDVEPESNIEKVDMRVDKRHATNREGVKSVRDSASGVVTSGGSGYIKVLMGNVLYGVSDVESMLRGEAVKRLYNKMGSDYNVTVKAELGDYNVAPSREALSLDEDSYKQLSNQITKLIIGKYKEFTSEYGKFNWGSLYLVNKKFRHTPLWSILANTTLHGEAVRYLVQESRRNNKVYPLPCYTKGLIHNSYGTDYTMCGDLGKLNQHRFLNWDNEKLIVAYGDVKCLKRTLINVAESFHDNAQVLWANNITDAKWLCSYFGVPKDRLVKAEYYYVEKKRKTFERKKFGKSDNDQVITRHLKVREGWCEQDKVTLNESVVWVEDDDCSINEHSTYSKLYDICDAIGVTTIINKNAKTAGKIGKNGVQSFEDKVNSFVKQYKKAAILKSVWGKDNFSNIGLGERMLLPRVVAHRKLLSNIEKYGVELPWSISLDMFGWKDTPMYKQEVSRWEKVVSDVDLKLTEMKGKLPLLNRFCGQSDIEYYLKLEKVIK